MLGVMWLICFVVDEIERWLSLLLVFCCYRRLDICVNVFYCCRASSLQVLFFLFLTAYSNFMHTTFLCALQFRSFINQRIITTNGANKLTHIRKKITAIYCLSYCERLFSSISCRLQINHRIYSWFEWYVMSWL